ncbi:hypothetical protein SNE510_58550 [Streptomyces sp. NE5-10]|uniref:hypothetical protein n=1 Tax=Streptomyces sp. NE5-10 TaxID=2759674 RepID=UPI001907BC79|nr:hypothetical protein [Streptomyces sp. NE5-10]GHJ96336.1 hypothetical protein SNE510_58550 [Streptomyces sp. NE5-10]
MNGTVLVLRALHRGEQDLAAELASVAERHAAEHEIHHVALDLAAWSREHVERLERAARPHGLYFAGADQDGSAPGSPATPTARPAGARGSGPEPGLLLLHDLRDLHLRATENSLYWEMLAQVAQATRDDRALGLASDCHPRTLRQIRWTNTMIKTLSPQALSSL